MYVYDITCRTRVIPCVIPERSKPVTELPVPSTSAIYDVHVFEPHKGVYIVIPNTCVQ